MQVLGPPISREDAERRLRGIAAQYVEAGGAGAALLGMIDGPAESLAGLLPPRVRESLGAQTLRALKGAMAGAHWSRRLVGALPGWLNRAVVGLMGALGGAGGLPTALAELPATTTALLRAIQDVAAEQGFDPGEEGVRHDCIQVLAASGPLSRDEGADMAFLGMRLTVGTTLQSMILRVAPRLSAVLGQKLALQAAPGLGAAAGATINYLYTDYYQRIAQVHFGLRRLAIDADMDHAEVVGRFRALVAESRRR